MEKDSEYLFEFVTDVVGRIDTDLRNVEYDLLDPDSKESFMEAQRLTGIMTDVLSGRTDWTMAMAVVSEIIHDTDGMEAE